MSTRHAGTVRMRIGSPRIVSGAPKIGRRTDGRKRGDAPSGTGRPDFDAVQNVLLNILNEPFDEVGRIVDEAS